MKRAIGMFLAASLLAAPSAWAIDITIASGATMQVGAGNTVTISPVTLNTSLPAYPAGNYSITFQWHSGINALVPISATRLGGGGTVTGGTVGTEINGVVVESETLVADSFGGCMIRVRFRNRTGGIKSVGIVYNAYDASGAGIGFTIASGIVPANSVATLEQVWTTTGSGLISCSRIARFSLDQSASYVFP